MPAPEAPRPRPPDCIACLRGRGPLAARLASSAAGMSARCRSAAGSPRPSMPHRRRREPGLCSQRTGSRGRHGAARRALEALMARAAVRTGRRERVSRVVPGKYESPDSRTGPAVRRGDLAARRARRLAMVEHPTSFSLYGTASPPRMSAARAPMAAALDRGAAVVWIDPADPPSVAHSTRPNPWRRWPMGTSARIATRRSWR